MNKNQQSGFLLIGLVIAVAIIAIIFAVMYGGKGQDKKTLEQKKQDATKDINHANDNLKEYQTQIDMQNDINSIQN